MTVNLMHIKSEAKSEGIIYKDTRYVRFSYFVYELEKDIPEWWIRNPLDTLTKVRDSELFISLENAYANLIKQKPND